VVVEETDESAFWLEFLVDTEILKEEEVKDLLQEAGELLKIFSASRHTAKKAHSKERAQSPVTKS